MNTSVVNQVTGHATDDENREEKERLQHGCGVGLSSLHRRLLLDFVQFFQRR